MREMMRGARVDVDPVREATRQTRNWTCELRVKLGIASLLLLHHLSSSLRVTRRVSSGKRLLNGMTSVCIASTALELNWFRKCAATLVSALLTTCLMDSARLECE